MRVVLIGHGISHSASPAMQEAAFRAAGLDWSYEIVDVPPEGLEAAVARVRAEEMPGANVTMPHKIAVMGLLDGLEGEAERAGAVNTIRRQGNRLLGSNTDVVGMRSAAGAAGVEPRGARVVVLGVGGAARAAAAALVGARLTFVARDPVLAGGLLGDVLDWSDPEWTMRTRRADLLVNATPLGRHGEMPLRPNALPIEGAVVDFVYVKGGTPLVRKARSLGIRCVDGWSILLAQGAAAFQAWTGREAPVEAMRSALDE